MRPVSITAAHLERRALIYLRQSSGFQVEHHTGSTARQFQLNILPLIGAGLPDRIVVIDGDLGVSGTGTRFRTGFQDMLALINSGQVGAVFVVHESRLARNIWDFVQFVTICECHHVLLVIDGTVKDPGEDRDRLLTLVMGAFADYENRDGCGSYAARC